MGKSQSEQPRGGSEGSEHRSGPSPLTDIGGSLRLSLSPAVTYLCVSYSATVVIVEHTLQLFLQVVDFSQILEMKDGGGWNRGSEFADARLRWFHQLPLLHCWLSQVRNGGETWVDEETPLWSGCAPGTMPDVAVRLSITMCSRHLHSLPSVEVARLRPCARTGSHCQQTAQTMIW